MAVFSPREVELIKPDPAILPDICGEIRSAAGGALLFVDDIPVNVEESQIHWDAGSTCN